MKVGGFDVVPGSLKLMPKTQGTQEIPVVPKPSMADAGTLTVYAPWGNYAAIKMENAKLGLSEKPGEVAIFQKSTGLHAKYFPDTYYNVGGGGRNAAQSGTFTINKPETPVVYKQESKAKPGFADTANVTEALKVLANPKGYSRLGAEAYGGFVQPLDARTIQSTGARYSTYANKNNLANFVNPQGVNLKKSEAPGARIPWEVPANTPSLFYMNEKGIIGRGTPSLDMIKVTKSVGGEATITPAPGIVSRNTVYRPSDFSLETLRILGGGPVSQAAINTADFWLSGENPVAGIAKSGSQLLVGKDIFSRYNITEEIGQKQIGQKITETGTPYQEIADLGGGSYKVTTFTPVKETQDITIPVTTTITPVKGGFDVIEEQTSQRVKNVLPTAPAGTFRAYAAVSTPQLALSDVAVKGINKVTGQQTKLPTVGYGEFIGGEYKGLREKPLTTGASYAIGVGLGAAFEGFGWGASKASAMVVGRSPTIAKGIELAPKAVGYGLGGLYAADVAVRSQNNLEKFGGIFSTEVAPLTAGGMTWAYRGQIVPSLKAAGKSLVTQEPIRVPAGYEAGTTIRASPELGMRIKVDQSQAKEVQNIRELYSLKNEEVLPSIQKSFTKFGNPEMAFTTDKNTGRLIGARVGSDPSAIFISKKFMKESVLRSDSGEVTLWHTHPEQTLSGTFAEKYYQTPTNKFTTKLADFLNRRPSSADYIVAANKNVKGVVQEGVISSKDVYAITPGEREPLITQSKLLDPIGRGINAIDKTFYDRQRLGERAVPLKEIFKGYEYADQSKYIRKAEDFNPRYVQKQEQVELPNIKTIDLRPVIDLSKAEIITMQTPKDAFAPQMTIDLPFYYTESIVKARTGAQVRTYDPFSGMDFNTKTLRLPEQPRAEPESLLRSVLASREITIPKTDIFAPIATDTGMRYGPDRTTFEREIARSKISKADRAQFADWVDQVRYQRGKVVPEVVYPLVGTGLVSSRSITDSIVSTKTDTRLDTKVTPISITSQIQVPKITEITTTKQSTDLIVTPKVWFDTVSVGRAIQGSATYRGTYEWVLPTTDLFSSGPKFGRGPAITPPFGGGGGGGGYKRKRWWMEQFNIGLDIGFYGNLGRSMGLGALSPGRARKTTKSKKKKR